ncbi:DUF3841 domain-containing protein [Paenibacillus sp. 481]|uniref:DUF3841 domain-containing protein n=1 Tax=Paenibacillus sp. 481 TaxID=2835869 RepID=UPI001E567452|nr:DUF3841 domain-containing protein [Paenibacillus sp. 481]UHA73255.1 DUF3841 domain-containing protein [Paenibacillus sp. 481]
MKLWTIQSLQAWEKALEQGELAGHSKYVWESFIHPYHWMMEQMKLRIANYTGEYPIWLWTIRPDLRCSGHLERGLDGVLLEVELRSEDVLISDFQAWHMVLNDSFLAFDEEEEALFNNGKLSITKEQSWERIFDYSTLYKHEYWCDAEYDLQVVTGRISLEQVKLLKTFKAR